MIIGYYNLWTDILIKSLNIVANVRNCFFFNILSVKLQILKVIDGKGCLKREKTLW